jgi:hypothetical protein
MGKHRMLETLQWERGEENMELQLSTLSDNN